MVTNEKLQSFLSSTALVIDDEISEETSTISKIVGRLEQCGTLFVKRNALLESIESLVNLSFIILDWDLKTEEEKTAIQIGAELGAAFYQGKKEANKSFIKQIINNYFIPIFIFSQENIDSIKTYLENDSIIKSALNNGRVFVCDKGSLKDDQVIVSLNTWLNESTAVYTFKIMEDAIEKAKHRFFKEMHNCDCNWPCYVYQNLKNDNPADLNSDFQDFLMTSFASTIEPITFNPEGFDKQVSLDSTEVVKIFSRIKFLSYEDGSNIGLHSGDLYVNSSPEKDEYLINVSAGCDMRYKKCYFVKGEETSSPRNHDIACTFTVKRILDKRGIEFHLNEAELIYIQEDLNKIIIVKEGESNVYIRKGRLLNPYIIALQNKYSNYITRTGVVREP